MYVHTTAALTHWQWPLLSSFCLCCMVCAISNVAAPAGVKPTVAHECHAAETVCVTTSPFSCLMTDMGSACSATILAAIQTAIQKYMAPVPVNVTATLAQQRRLLLQSSPSYTVNIQVRAVASRQDKKSTSVLAGKADQTPELSLSPANCLADNLQPDTFLSKFETILSSLQPLL